MKHLIYTFMVVDHHQHTVEEKKIFFLKLARFQGSQAAWAWSAVEIVFRKIKSEKYVFLVTFFRHLPYAFLRC